ncbi:hypothetical protein HMPREF3037_00363 [Candidatus Stoquefichus sp. KLE1796]|nr:hypothetical protein HMPREF3037_00363 [Candidatus Stoquefichus sp. KLE1796]
MMKQTLLTCIEIAQNKGILFNESDLNKAKEYVKNMLDENELDAKINEIDFRLNVANALLISLDKESDAYKKASETNERDLIIKQKLMKQKELLR